MRVLGGLLRKERESTGRNKKGRKLLILRPFPIIMVSMGRLLVSMGRL